MEAATARHRITVSMYSRVEAIRHLARFPRLSYRGRVTRSIAPATYTAVTIGNFDGVHLGHAALVRRARKWVDHAVTKAGGNATARVVVLCFDPHPLATLRPGNEPARLTSFAQRQEWLREIGADEVERLEPSREFLSQSPEQFIDWLVTCYRPAVIVEGPDFRFGKGRAGSVDILREFGDTRGFETVVVTSADAVLSDQSVVRASSSIVRWLLRRGRVRDAALVLGRPFELRGRVHQGDQRGRSIGVPTANLDHGELLLPADGIYSGKGTAPDGNWYAAAISVGTKPTFGEHPTLCEAHLIGYDGSFDQYGWTMRLEFHDWLRDQLTFRNENELISQLHRDIRNCQLPVTSRTIN